MGPKYLDWRSQNSYTPPCHGIINWGTGSLLTTYPETSANKMPTWSSGTHTTFHACLYSHSDHSSRCRWLTHLTNRSCFNHRKNLNTPNWYPMFGADSWISGWPKSVLGARVYFAQRKPLSYLPYKHIQCNDHLVRTTFHYVNTWFHHSHTLMLIDWYLCWSFVGNLYDRTSHEFGIEGSIRRQGCMYHSNLDWDSFLFCNWLILPVGV